MQNSKLIGAEKSFAPPQESGLDKTAVDEHEYRRPFIVITLVFFLWGFITVMNGLLIPYLMEGFSLSYFQAGLVQFAFFGAFFLVSLIYYLVSLFQGDPINRVGYKTGIIVALFICAAGCALFYPAAGYQKYGFFLGALFLLATGVTLLNITANPYVTILGPSETASSRLNLSGGVNSLGTMLGPIVGGLLLYGVFAKVTEVTLDSIKFPYVIYCTLFVVLGAIVWRSHLPQFTNRTKVEKGLGALRFPHLRLGMIAVFMYLGGEVAIGSYLVSVMNDAQIMGLPEATASLFLAYYWGGMMIGRLCGSISLSGMANQRRKYVYMAVTAIVVFLAVYLATAIRLEEGEFMMVFMTPAQVAPFLLLIVFNYIAFVFGKGSPSRVLGIFSLCVIGLLAIAAFAGGSIAFWAALGTGLFNSIMWASIFPLAIKDLKQYTSQGSSLLMMMVVGGAVFTLAMGVVADRFGIQLAFAIPIINYVYIAFYGFSGYKVSRPGVVGGYRPLSGQMGKSAPVGAGDS